MLQITKGKKLGAVRAVIYGTEGIGKTTLASKIPDSLVIDTEDGSSQLDVARTLALDWRAIEHATKELVDTEHEFKAAIFDSADWVEKSIIEHMLKQKGKKSIEDFGFGKGFTMLQEEFNRFLALTDKLIAKGIHVIFVAHSTVTRTSPPDQTDGFDRYELKLSKKVAPILKEWADLVLFCNYKLQIVEGGDGRLKAQGGRERVMYAVRTAAWDAKNRYGLPDEMPMDFAQIAHLFGNAAPRDVKNVTPVAQPTPTTVSEKEEPAPLATHAEATQVNRILDYKQRGVGLNAIEAALEAAGAIDVEELSFDEAAALIAVLKAEAPLVILPTPFTSWLDANASSLEAYLATIKWISEGQTWRDLPEDKQHQLLDKHEKLARAAKIPPYGAKAA